MNPILILAKDVWFLAALLVFLTGLGILFWCVAQLGRASSRPANNSRSASPRPMAPPQDPSYMRPSFAPSRIAEPMPNPPQSSFANEASVMYGVLEERFSDLAKRITTLEGRRETPAADPSHLQPLMKRLDELEKEIEKLRISVTQTTGASRGGDLSVLNEKISTMQRMMESLALESDAPKPT